MVSPFVKAIKTYFTVWKDIQKRYKEMIADSFAPLPIYNAPLFEQEIVGLEMLERMGDALYSGPFQLLWPQLSLLSNKFNVATDRIKSV